MQRGTKYFWFNKKMRMVICFRIFFFTFFNNKENHPEKNRNHRHPQRTSAEKPYKQDGDECGDGVVAFPLFAVHERFEPLFASFEVDFLEALEYVSLVL